MNMELIAANEFCRYHQVEITLVHSMYEKGLIDLIIIEENSFIEAEQLPVLEKLIRMHNDLEINLEGLEAIAHLLQKIEFLQEELQQMKTKLRVFEY